MNAREFLQETEADEAERLAALQKRAADRGMELARVTSGYMLRRGTVSQHTPSLETIEMLLGGGSE